MFSVNAIEQSNAFIISINDSGNKVIAPETVDKKVGVIINNRTLSDVRGKIVNEDRSVVINVNILSNNSESFEVPYSKDGKLTFIPISPSFQEVVLVVGEKSYEVPNIKNNGQ